jgi:hypothetical protein
VVGERLQRVSLVFAMLGAQFNDVRVIANGEEIVSASTTPLS